MCGISGLWQVSSEVSPARIRAFTEPIAHRGPDGFGYSYHAGGRLALGHRRLSIFDPSAAGKQPMRYEHLTLTFNGEVYNFLELRARLEKRGHRFRSDTDTEVVLHAYAEWGPQCLERFNGMWALAIFDERHQRLFLARDRFGIKPLYVLQEPARFSFASETGCWRQLESYQRQFDPAAVRTALTDAPALLAEGRTLYRDIRMLPPGGCGTVEANGRYQERRWYAPPFAVPLDARPVSERELTDLGEAFLDRFDAACTLRLRADVPLATALSGGIDSSSVYATVRHLLQRGAVRRGPKAAADAFTLSFPGSERDETEQAARLVTTLRGRHHLVRPTQSAERIATLTRRFDTIYSDPNYIICDLYSAVREAGFKVSLDGHGVDELLFGYPHMVGMLRNWARFDAPALARKLDRLLLQQTAFQRSAPVTWRTRLSRLRQRWFPARPAGRSTAPHEILHHNFSVRYLPNILRNFDFASMQAGVEVRMPFMDHELVEWVARLPLGAFTNGHQTKYILRRATHERLPARMRRDKTKIGLQAPLTQLLNGPLNDWASDLVASATLRQASYFDGASVAASYLPLLRTGRLANEAARQLWPYLNYAMLAS